MLAMIVLVCLGLPLIGIPILAFAAIGIRDAVKHRNDDEMDPVLKEWL